MGAGAQGVGAAAGEVAVRGAVAGGEALGGGAACLIEDKGETVVHLVEEVEDYEQQMRNWFPPEF